MEQQVPFAPQLLYALDREGTLWFGVNDEYRITRRNLSGDTLLILEMDFEPASVSPEEHARALEARGITLIRESGGKVDLSLIPNEKPAFNRFVVASDGSLWVWPLVEESDAAPIDVFQPDGRYLGRIEGPGSLSNVPLPVIREDQLVAVVQDSLDFPAVVRFRIER